MEIIYIVIIFFVFRWISKSGGEKGGKKKTSGTNTKSGVVVSSGGNVALNTVVKDTMVENVGQRTLEDMDVMEPESTMEMLQRKAEEEQEEHDREKRYAEYKRKKTYNGKHYAQRFVPGDSVPRGMKIRCCAYCGAENLVTVGMGEKLLCYFCREEL